MELEEDETERARRAKIMQFMNPKINRSSGPRSVSHIIYSSLLYLLSDQLSYIGCTSTDEGTEIATTWTLNKRDGTGCAHSSTYTFTISSPYSRTLRSTIERCRCSFSGNQLPNTGNRHSSSHACPCSRTNSYSPNTYPFNCTRSQEERERL